MASKSYFFSTAISAVKASGVVADFVNRYEGTSIDFTSDSVHDDGVRIYTIPPGIVVVQRPQVEKNSVKPIMRYDIVSLSDSSDNLDRKEALYSQLLRILKGQS